MSLLGEVSNASYQDIFKYGLTRAIDSETANPPLQSPQSSDDSNTQQYVEDKKAGTLPAMNGVNMVAASVVVVGGLLLIVTLIKVVK